MGKVKKQQVNAVPAATAPHLQRAIMLVDQLNDLKAVGHLHLVNSFKVLSAAAKARTHESFVPIHCFVVNNDQTFDECIVLGYHAKGNFFLGVSKHVHKHGDGCYSKPTILPQNVEGYHDFFKAIPVENSDLPNKVQNAFKKLADEAENVHHLMSQKPDRFFEKYVSKHQTNVPAGEVA